MALAFSAKAHTHAYAFVGYHLTADLSGIPEVFQIILSVL